MAKYGGGSSKLSDSVEYDMAKSLRSKSRRRNVKAKREKYNARAIEQLKKTLGLTKEAEKTRQAEIMQDLSEIAAAIEAYEENNKVTTGDVEMEETEKSDSKTKETKLKDGQQPVWKSQRKIKAAKKAKKVAKKIKKKAPAKKVTKAKAKGGKNKK